MQTNEAPTYSMTIWIAGDAAEARQVCREYCHRVGLCVTVTETTFIYTGGEEAGVQIRLLNYPRFPSAPDELWSKAQDLADLLLMRLCQHSYTLETTDTTRWVSRKDENPAARG